MTLDEAYTVLGLTPSAGRAKVKEAWRKLALSTHPDRKSAQEQSQAGVRMADINKARDVILGRLPPESRPAPPTAPPRAPSPARSHATAAHDGHQRPPNHSRGADVKVTATISFEEAYSGCARTIDRGYTGRCTACEGKGFQVAAEGTSCPTCQGKRRSFIGEPCAPCNGTGSIMKRSRCGRCAGTGQATSSTEFTYTIPAGCKPGEVICFKGEGERNVEGAGPAGDFYVTVDFDLPTPFRFDRDGILAVTVPVSFWTWVGGGVIRVPAPSGHVLPATLGCQMKGLLIEGVGWPRSSGGAGPLRVIAAIEMPKPGELNTGQLALLEALEAHATPTRRQWEATVTAYLDQRDVRKTTREA